MEKSVTDVGPWGEEYTQTTQSFIFFLLTSKPKFDAAQRKKNGCAKVGNSGKPKCLYSLIVFFNFKFKVAVILRAATFRLNGPCWQTTKDAILSFFYLFCLLQLTFLHFFTLLTCHWHHLRSSPADRKKMAIVIV